MPPETQDLTTAKTASWQMFNAISGRYDLLNRVLSLGLDLRWRERLTEFLPQRQDLSILDIATGTADVPIILCERSTRVKSVHGLDRAEEMLKIGQKKIEQKGLSPKITLQHGDALNLPFPGAAFDAVTIAFGIRNLPDLMKALMEMFRVLKPGGRLLVLEFSRPSNILLKAGHLGYLRFGVPLLGGLFSGNAAAYRYLNRTIEAFPHGERFGRIIRQVGFKTVTVHPLLGGTASIYEGNKD